MSEKDDTIKTPEEREIELSRKEKALLGEIAEAKEQLDQYLAAVNSAKTESAEATAELNLIQNKIAGLQTLLADYGNKKAEYEAILDTQNETIKITEETIAGKIERRKSIEAQLSTLEADLATAIASAQQRENDAIKDLKSQKDKLQTEKDAIDSDIENATKHLNAIKEATELVLQKNKELSGEVSDLTTQAVALNGQLETARKELKAVQDGVASAKGRQSDVETKIIALNAELASLEARRKEATDAVTEIEKNLADTTAEYETAKLRLFNISRREQNVKQQEDYVREQFKIAGITYQEYQEQ